MMRRVFSVCVAMWLWAAGAAAAQERGSVGLVAAAPGTVGVLWQTTDRLAIRPAVSFAHVSSDTQTNLDPRVLAATGPELLLYQPLPDLSSSSTDVALDLSLLWTLTRRDAFRLYVAPEIGGIWMSDRFSAGRGDTDDVRYRAAGLLGGQFALNERFMVFGETGLRYQRDSARYFSSSLARIEIETSTHAFSSLSRVGLAIYF